MDLNKQDIFKKWDQNASVRTSPIRKLESMDGFHFFSSSVSPILAINLIKDLPVESIKYLEIQLLFRYLSFTEYLETNLVNTEILKISNDDYNLGFSQTTRINAYKIYCDEAFHAYQAADMKSQIEKVSGISPLSFNVNLNSRLEALKHRFHSSIREYFYLFFVAVSECLVSQELNGYVKDQTIHPEIHGLMKDHARDEVAHAIFFSGILNFLCERLEKDRFQYFVAFVPEFLGAYLLPNNSDLIMILEKVTSRSTIDKVLNDLSQPKFIQSFLEVSSKSLNTALAKIQGR